ncbi:MAG: PfkB family carbohydrate kinase [Anaerolineae bacterium]|nr:PfkB family carbohydrate kinase [Anaerolineae bacterium]
MNAPDYLVVGHVTCDLVPGGFRVGGTATYAAMTARALGYRVAVLTSAGTDLPLATTFAGIDLRVVPATRSTTFENVYRDGYRVQFIRASAARLTARDLPEEWRRARIVHLGPLDQEVEPALVDAFPAETLIGVTPQGWLRRWDADGRVSSRRWTEARRILRRADAMVLSREDVGNDEEELNRYLSLARLAAVTESWQGATLHHRGRSVVFPAYNVREVDPTGAGDVFAAAFFISLAETGDPEEAARFANAAASFAVEGEGYSTVATRAAVEERLRSGVLRGRDDSGGAHG